MNIDRLNGWLTLIGNMGVIAGIIFLTLEMQQSNRIALGSGEIALRAEFRELTAGIYENPDLAEALLVLTTDKINISEGQELLIRAYLRNQAAFFMSAQSAFDNGIISEGTFEAYLNVATRTIQSQPNWGPFIIQALQTRDGITPNRMTEHLLQVTESL